MSRPKLTNLLQSMGCTADDSGYSFHCDAPVGYVWVANDLGTLSIHYATNSESWWGEEIVRELPALRMGLRLANEDEIAELSHSNDKEWVAPAGSPQTIAFPA